LYDMRLHLIIVFFFFQAEDGIRDRNVTGVQTCALPISSSIDRGLPLHKSLKKQRTKKHITFFKRQRLYMSTKDKVDLDALGKSFNEKRYKVKRDGDNLLLEKGRLSRYGPHINYRGSIILLFGS